MYSILIDKFYDDNIPLSIDEKQYIKSSVDSIPVKHIDMVYDTVKERIINNRKRIKKATKPVDVHEVLKQEIKQPGPTLLNRINPAATMKRAYFILDRRYHNRSKSFSWDLKELSIINIENVLGAKVHPFRFPYTETAITFPMRLSINIEEFGGQAYISHVKNFQFIFELKKEGSGTEPYQLIDTGGTYSEFWCATPITTMDSITINFGNPFNKITLDPDQLYATISSDGAQTLLTFTQPHMLLANDIVYIENFATDSADDYTETALLNSIYGWKLASVTSSTAHIDVDISSLSGSIINNPYLIYFDSKRFAIPIEIYYRI